MHRRQIRSLAGDMKQSQRATPRATEEEKLRALDLWASLGSKVSVMRILARETGIRRDISTINTWIREAGNK